ncbi:MAG: hypothetical protein Q6363_006350 [Candidatus Njordarchaeota archaeon]
MRFYSKKAIIQIVKSGIVATLCDFSFSFYQKVFVKINGIPFKLRGRVVGVIKNPKIKHLLQYLDISGFSSVGEWINETKRIHQRIPRFLVIFVLTDSRKKLLKNYIKVDA